MQLRYLGKDFVSGRINSLQTIMKRFLFILVCAAIGCWALIGQSRNARNTSSAPAGVGINQSPSTSDYREELRNEKREVREKRREQRLAEYTRYMDSIVLSHNFRFNPQTMQQQPAGSMRMISNTNFNLALWDTTVDVCLPYIKGFTPPYRYTILNYTLPTVSNLLTEQTHNGWTVSFNSSLFSAQTYAFTLEIFSAEGSGILTISTPMYSTVQYSGSITGLY